MYTTQLGKTKFMGNSDLSGDLIINNAPAVKAGETDERMEVRVPCADVMRFVIDSLSEKIKAQIENILEDRQRTKNQSQKLRDLVESAVSLARLSDEFEDPDDLDGM